MYIALFNNSLYETPEEARHDDQLYALAENIPANFTAEQFDMIQDAVFNTCLMTPNDFPPKTFKAVLVEGTFSGGKITYPVQASEWYKKSNELQDLQDEYLNDSFSIEWHIDDVLEECPDLTKEQARVVLHEVSRRHDACYGINWGFIRDIAWILYPPKEED